MGRGSRWIEDRESKKSAESSDSDRLRVDGRGTERARDFDSLTRYSIVSQLRAGPDSGFRSLDRAGRLSCSNEWMRRCSRKSWLLHRVVGPRLRWRRGRPGVAQGKGRKEVKDGVGALMVKVSDEEEF